MSGTTGLYSNNDLLSSISYTQTGAVASSVYAWSGSLTGGEPGGYPLGGGEVYDGTIASAAAADWITGYITSDVVEFSMYALSTPIFTPLPEPATITLLGSALSLLAGFGLLRRRRMANPVS